ncbi:MAG: ATP-dependent DNA helicase RecG [Candidatus Dojkabacteria bacterium]
MDNLTANSPVGILKGVGHTQAEKLSKLGIETVKDLLFHIPFRYRDTSDILTIEEFKESSEGVFLAQVVETKNIYTRTRKVLGKVRVRDENSTLDLSFFNQPYITKTLKKDQWYIFDAKISQKGKTKNIYNPKYEKYDGDISKQKHLGKIIGIYPETEGLTSRNIRNILSTIKGDIKNLIEEPLPKDIVKETISLAQSIKAIHFPKSRKDIIDATNRLALDEMLRVALKLEQEKLERKKLTAFPIIEDKLLSKDFFSSLPFKLTKDQIKSIGEILSDISKKTPMNRLLNGDVGSGKTVVAALAILQCIRNGYSAVVLAPTTVLAQQHFDTFKKLLKPFNIDIQLWISSKKTKDISTKRVIIGTHAVLFKENIPDNLNLVVVDEQHRFGVKQREQLLKVNKQTPHYLTMSATPIPRSLTEIVFGSTKVSTIKEKPKGRKEIDTKYVPYNKRDDCFNWISKKIKDSNFKQQAFIVYPLIEESYSIDAKAVLTEFENLKNNNFKDINIELLHGRIAASKKDEILERFRKKEFNILVTTSVIEVGIDIPDATVMVIEDAHRFGLAQLHQLRGRVGRSDISSYCFVIASKDQEVSSVDRLKYFASHSSGFDVAEYDLKTRGPGEVYGIKQSGIPQFKVASLTDIKLFKEAKHIAKEILRRDNLDLGYIDKNLFK